MAKPGAGRSRAKPRRHAKAAPGGAGQYRMFVRDFVLSCRIGVHAHERETAQRVRVNVDLAVDDVCAATGDDIAAVVSYEDVVFGVRAVAASGHINLVETMADQIADHCLADPRVRAARVRVEKLDVFPQAESVGVEIERVRAAS